MDYHPLPRILDFFKKIGGNNFYAKPDIPLMLINNVSSKRPRGKRELLIVH